MELLILVSLIWLGVGLWFVWHADDAPLTANVMLVLLWPYHVIHHIAGRR